MPIPVSSRPRRVCVFCGSAPGNREAFGQAAMLLGVSLARRNLGLVFGGGKVGLMGILADAVLSNGGRVTGVIPTFLSSREIAHDGLQDLRVVGSMHERKALMANLSDAFLVMPGGMGTLDEMCEILTWAQLGLHAKPVGLLNVEGYFDSFLAFLDQAVSEGFVRDQHRRLLCVSREGEALVDDLAARMPEREPPIDEREV